MYESLITESEALVLNPVKPNLLFIFSDQHRGMDMACAGNPNLRTPNFDRLAETSVFFSTAVSNIPVCTPARASLITGQYPLTHELIVNDIPLFNHGVTVAEALKGAGYATGYIGKWHIAGGSWSAFIPEDQRKGFEFWRTCECTHDYNASIYHAEEPGTLQWEGYDAFAQTDCAMEYMKASKSGGQPFALFLSWGPPHDPYETAPEKYRKQYPPESITLRSNVPEDMADETREKLSGYYAHIAALDDAMGSILDFLKHNDLFENSVIVYTSDHGDMLGSQGHMTKEKPWDESIRIPLMIKAPDQAAGSVDAPVGIVDLMPTVLDLCGVPIPSTVEGVSYASAVRGESTALPEGVLIECIQPFGSWGKIYGGREYRGLRTARYTYARDLDGPWLLYDNLKDPCQQTNLIDCPNYTEIREDHDAELMKMLDNLNDEFKNGEYYMDQFGYKGDETGRVPIEQ